MATIATQLLPTGNDLVARTAAVAPRRRRAEAPGATAKADQRR